MIIRVVLILAILTIMLWFLRQRTTTRGQAWSKIVLFVVVCLAIIAVVSPSILNRLAHGVGVGRGADLLLYCLTVLFLASLLNQYMHRQDEQLKTIQLARKIALHEASRDPHNVAIGQKIGTR